MSSSTVAIGANGFAKELFSSVKKKGQAAFSLYATRFILQVQRLNQRPTGQKFASLPLRLPLPEGTVKSVQTYSKAVNCGPVSCFRSLSVSGSNKKDVSPLNFSFGLI